MELIFKTGMLGPYLAAGSLSKRLAKWFAAALITFLLSGSSFANVIDSIEVARVDDKAQITIRFATEIQYLRHGPDDEGKFLRVFFRVSKPGFTENELMQETLRSPASDLVPRFTLAYPELVNGMLITFAKPTKFSVAPGKDGRSIVILVPLSPEQKLPPPATETDKSALVTTPPIAPTAVVPSSSTKRKSRKSAERKSPAVAPVPATAALPSPAPINAPSAVAVAPVATQTPDVDKPDASPAMAQEKVETLAKGFMDEARVAFATGDYAKAINRLNRVLGLPANAQTEAGQALIGELREKNGEIAKARAEYELYLKLYPKSAEAPRIKQRLAALPTLNVIRRANPTRAARDEQPAEWQVSGSVSSYYFVGRSKQDASASIKDQESQVSSISLNARLRDSVTDSRIVFRDTDSRNYLRPDRNYNRIYSAYAERTDREVGYFVRAGRQNPNGGGVLERFDGLSGSYNLGADWKLNAVYGDAVEFNSPFKKNFYGGSIELLPQIARPGASLYLIEQNLDGYLNRRALGSEMRYFDGQFNAFGSIDYDLLYKGLNIVTAQGNYLDTWGNNYFVSYDYRKSPSYSLTNALYATSAMGLTNVNDLVSRVGISQARTLVVESTAASTMFAAGVTVPVGERWQFGTDYRTSSVSGTNVQLPLTQMCKSLGFNPADPNDPICFGGPLGDTPVSQVCAGGTFDPTNNTCQAGQSAQGRTNTYTVQAIGTNLFVPNGVGVASVSLNQGPDYSGENYGMNYIYPFTENWRLEGNLRYSTMKSNNGNGQSSFSPSLKLAHQWRSSLFLEGEVGISDQKTTGTSPSKNTREYLYLGMRWDYR